MAGLLGLDDDMRLALMTAGLGTLAGRGGPMRAAGQGGLLGVQSYQQSKRDKGDAERERLRDEMLRLQIENQREQMEMARRMAAEQEAARTGISSAFQGAMTPGSPGRPAGLGDVDMGMDAGVQPAMAPRAPSFDYARFAQGVAPYDQKMALSALEKAGPKEKKVKEQRPVMVGGVPKMAILYEDGTHEYAPYEPEADIKTLKLGDREVVYDARRAQPGQEWKIGTSPDTVYSGNISMRGQNMTDARAREANALTRSGEGSKAAAELRKEFNALPQVRAYGEVQPVIQSSREAISNDTAAADLNLIYAAAKIFDPTSVVRESETTMVVQSGSPAQRFMGQFNYVVGGGRLTPQARKQLMAQIESRARGYESGYRTARKAYEGVAERNKIDPSQVFIEPFATTQPSAGGLTPAEQAELDALKKRFGR